MGTAGYMSPEQARGKPVDKRADIWAFGVVLYEMLTGKRLFEGETISDTLAQVLTKEPDWEQVAGESAAAVAALSGERSGEAAARYRVARWLLLEEPPQVTAPSRSRLGWVVAGVAGWSAVALGFGWWRATRPVDRPL